MGPLSRREINSASYRSITSNFACPTYLYLPCCRQKSGKVRRLVYACLNCLTNSIMCLLSRKLRHCQRGRHNLRCTSAYIQGHPAGYLD